MIDYSNFKLWLMESQHYENKKTIGNIASRFKRANNILSWFNDEVYIFRLEQNTEFQLLSVTIRSQIKKAVSLYFEFANSRPVLLNEERKKDMNVLSLFANIGVAEAYLRELNVNVVVANELIERRALLYSEIYPETQMICGDITQHEIFDMIIKESIEKKVNIIMATPPCQGMSTVGQKKVDDERNRLIYPVIKAVKEIKPKYVLVENVPMFLNTKIKIDGLEMLIPDLLIKELGEDYIISQTVIDTKDYSVPQTRERALVLMTHRNQAIEWTVPEKENNIVTMREAIGELPILDPYVSDVDEEELLDIFPEFYKRKKQALSISKWHNPPHHIKRQVIAMQHTPSGKTAFDNEIYFPVKENGEAVKGFRNTYKRQNWDTPAYTVTMDNRKISSQNNVHPGRMEYTLDDGTPIYSDARTLTLYELMIIMSLPNTWPIPPNTSEAFLRRIIGEGIPPLFVKKVFESLREVYQ